MSEGNKIVLSIIIPVYKVEAFIRQCLDSLIIDEKELSSIEIIVINDGTTDNSACIAKEYESHLNGVLKVIDKENGGHGSAWNVGISVAQGKYIKFLDSDDWLENLSLMLEVLRDSDIDLVLFPILRFYEGTGRMEKLDICQLTPNVVYDADSFQWDTIKSSDFTDFWYAVYKTSIIKNYHPLFVEGVSFDDAVLFIAPIIWSHSFMYVDVPVYVYRIGREGQSISPAIQKKHALDYIPVSHSVVDFYLNNSRDISDNKRSKVQSIINLYLKNCFAFLESLDYQVFRDIIPEWYYSMTSALWFLLKNKEMVRFEKYPIFIFWGLHRLECTFDYIKKSIRKLGHYMKDQYNG